MPLFGSQSPIALYPDGMAGTVLNGEQPAAGSKSLEFAIHGGGDMGHAPRAIAIQVYAPAGAPGANWGSLQESIDDTDANFAILQVSQSTAPSTLTTNFAGTAVSETYHALMYGRMGRILVNSQPSQPVTVKVLVTG
jgi:hypothetical protein